MTTITTCKPNYTGIKDTKFEDAFAAVKFIRKMKREGYRVLDYMCDDPEDAETIGNAI